MKVLIFPLPSCLPRRHRLLLLGKFKAKIIDEDQIKVECNLIPCTSFLGT